MTAPARTRRRLAVLLFNLGGPDGPEDVQPFLRNLFSDPRIISLPRGVRHILAWIISVARGPSARANYAKMGGGSPLLGETLKQAEALERRLNRRAGTEARVFVGMRYWKPFIPDAARAIRAWGPDEVVVLPLYPQFSSTTTLSGFDAFDRSYDGPSRRVCCYAANDRFIAAHAKIVENWLKLLPSEPGSVRILFSAHGLPEKIVAAGDPYQEQIEATVSRVMAQVGPERDHVTCYQSRVGPLAWIGPSTEEAIRKAGADGKSVLVVPIAFVSEHIETRVELDMDYAELAGQVGIKTYARAPTLGVAPQFIAVLAEEVDKALGSTTPIVGDHDCGAQHGYCPRRRAA
ncbi:ferrochelatase [Brevundimonas sp.]|uniref:ferrochelatase n=1 Tax=Brevundimonas sp. TaxID=1871086 RepID=UPI002D26A48F|nr:ferrochelatase [Brevundimonas sp.]HYC98905.1 ferrochelatase [Brevundimonas sp.]